MRLATDISGPLTVVGDIHGNADALRSLLGQLAERADFADRWLVFVGDFVDRGPDSRGVLDTILKLLETRAKVTAVCGNHDFALAAALNLFATPAASNWQSRYTRYYDAMSTFASYGVEPGDLAGLRKAVPIAHQTLLAALPWAVFHSAYLIVHAGLLPDRSYAEQVADLQGLDRSLNSPPWLCDRSLAFAPSPKDCSLTIVSGHVRVPSVRFQERRVLVDVTGGTDSFLAAVLLPENLVITSRIPCRGNRNRAEED